MQWNPGMFSAIPDFAALHPGYIGSKSAIA